MPKPSEGYMKAWRAWIDETVRMREMNGKRTPTRFFKFMSNESDYFVDTIHRLISNNQIRLSGRKSFNDPFDTRFALDAPDSPEEIIAYMRDLHMRSEKEPLTGEEENEIRRDPGTCMEDIRQQTNWALDRFGIYSLTDRIDHPLMWSHYACSHRGIAVAFKNMLPLAPFPLRYGDTYPRCTLSAERSIEIFRAFEKGDQWSYEEEWRITNQDAAGSWKNIPSDCLHGFVLGAGLENTRQGATILAMFLEMIRDRVAAGQPLVRIYRARVVDSFDLVFEQLDGADVWNPANAEQLHGVRR